MLVSMVMVLDKPSDIADETLRERLDFVYKISLATHCICTFFQFIFQW